MKKAFTLLELLIVISVIVLIAVVAFITLNPKKQVEKSQDTKRKQELTQLGKVIEDYYNDKNCYPTPDKVCYNYTGGTTCNICGNDPNSPDFNPYLSSLPCDPQQPTKKYLYEVDELNCPSWYRIYTDLSNNSDPIIAEVGCSTGCGPNGIYDYGVSSSNVGLEASLIACLSSGSCSNYCSSIGRSCASGTVYETFSASECQGYLGICSGDLCCSQQPIQGQVNSFKCFAWEISNQIRFSRLKYYQNRTCK